ncbi:BRLZ domain containing protein [Pyrenophora tritici-repentis]|uniref:BRLZ domain containing protein n=2 Tax=Pyrenophora tritici-repentis TaxID=45151 RepID=A0A2W1EQZ8_9PLEO|nr:uncharacterized protein PTRG_09115 [Pyrenophora tritici-repentis Pt-1C-BFP]KAA8627708.1 BRLZ domain-containing protein [Pyrenophora tritici-repentis]EDU42166.1 conserved hypothetical protein [Pyrenophora tritici-repentis Pt-1C-BFP]KAF7442261.1 BRLZ domain containing protein [Pyrenophora tritici-repentis]KAF7579367.1 BRLZ domain containing protein [Pyrenophora tritici-repentis]KAG9378285.1 BRLZ domain containing protein [Pyrenophora tritici-repentis]
MTDIRVSQKAQNLARIRDNQRRSRARRKEYLQELEAKLRSYEQIGIEASSEIQSAARKVLEENKKLRALLHERGVSESEVVAALGGASDRHYDHITAGPRLNAMLERRIATTNMVSSTSSPMTSHIRAASMPRHIPSVTPIDVPQPRPTSFSCNDTPSPGSMYSNVSTPPPVSYPTAFYTTPMSPSVAEIKSEDSHYDYPYERPYNNAWAYTSDYTYTADPASYYNSSSCIDAANIIRTMRSNMVPEMEASLECRTSDQHCYINNTAVYDMVDKYTQKHATM